MSSDETSINSETKPSVQTVAGTSRQVATGVAMVVLAGVGAHRCSLSGRYAPGLRQLNRSPPDVATTDRPKKSGLSPQDGERPE